MDTVTIDKRCDWAESDELFFHYHDHEWGVPKYDTKVMFEYLVLEMMQAGLSWKIILQKRASIAKAFDQFDYKKITGYSVKKVDQLLADPGIIRNRLKVNAVINNAQCCLQLEQEGTDFSQFIWQLTAGKPIINHWQEQQQCPASTELSYQMSKMLKAYGFKFIGTTICYSFMQAIGMVNDHLLTCAQRY